MNVQYQSGPVVVAWASERVSDNERKNANHLDEMGMHVSNLNGSTFVFISVS